MKEIKPRYSRQKIADLKRQLGIWLGLPEGARDPLTLRELAAQMDIKPEVLSKWKKDSEVLAAKESAVKLFFMSNKRMTIFIKSIEDGLKSGNASTQALYAKMTGLVDSGKKEESAPEIKVTFQTSKE